MLTQSDRATTLMIGRKLKCGSEEVGLSMRSKVLLLSFGDWNCLTTRTLIPHKLINTNICWVGTIWTSSWPPSLHNHHHWQIVIYLTVFNNNIWFNQIRSQHSLLCYLCIVSSPNQLQRPDFQFVLLFDQFNISHIDWYSQWECNKEVSLPEYDDNGIKIKY